jgi:F-type H+-transporting ATPase subunit b
VKAILSLCAALLIPAVAEAAAEHHAAHGVPWLKLIFMATNFAIFAAILHRYAWPAVRDVLQTRHANIVAALEQAAWAKAESERLKNEWELRLANLNAEMEEMRRQVRAEIEAERERILAAARDLAASIQRDAVRAAEQEVRTAEAALRKEVAEQALSIARSLAPARMTADQQGHFVSDFITQVRS